MLNVILRLTVKTPRNYLVLKVESTGSLATPFSGTEKDIKHSNVD